MIQNPPNPYHKNGPTRIYFVWWKVYFLGGCWIIQKNPQYFTNACKTIWWFDDGLVGWINEYNSKSRQIDPFAIPFFQFLGYRGISRHPLYPKDLIFSQTHIVSPIWVHQRNLFSYPLLHFPYYFHVVDNSSKLLYLSGVLVDTLIIKS